jgi:nucleotide sugar dehydrogenase
MQGEVLVVGLGRIGLPVALVMADSGYIVRGVDSSTDGIKLLSDGIAPFKEPGLDDLLSKHHGNNFYPITWEESSSELFRNIRWVVVTIGVHNLPWPEPADLSILYSVIESLHEKNCLKDRTIILRTTLPVGTTKIIADWIESTYELIVGTDFNLAFIPERLVEGMAIMEERTLPKIIGPCNENALEEAKILFSSIGGNLIEMSTPEGAEFVKLIDNAWRHTRFAFANDAALAASANGVDITEVIAAANRDYDRNTVALPGPVSGYCLGKDPLIFEYAFQNIEPKRELPSVWLTALKSSQSLVPWTVNQVKGPNVLVAGLSFKENIDDFRMAFSEPLIESLLKSGFEVSVCDPNLKENMYTQLWPSIEGKINHQEKDLSKLLELKTWDTIIIAVRHDIWKDIGDSLKNQGLIIDLWNMYNNVEGLNRIGLGSG